MSPKSQDVKQSGLFGFLAQPDAPTKSGVVILPTIFGVNSFVRGYAETLARAGLAAAVWDHYEGLPLTTDYEESKARARKLGDAGMHAKVGKWVDYMLGDLQLTSVGVLGFCLGGRYVLMAAAQDKRIKACAAAYPSIEKPRLPAPGGGRGRARRRHPLPRARRATRPRPCRQRGDLRRAEGNLEQTRRAHDLAILSRRRARLHASQGAGGQSGGDRDRLAATGRLSLGLPVVNTGPGRLAPRPFPCRPRERGDP